ncbi:MAG: class I adenylate-forming enzyme family protein [Sciscionella sp.]
MPLATLPDTRAKADAAGICLTDADGAVTNGQFAERVRAVAAQLGDHGLRAGGVVGVMLTNRVALVVVMFAAWRLGAAVTPVNPALTDIEAGHQLSDSGAKILISEARPSPVDTAETIDVTLLRDTAPRAGAGPLPRTRAGDLALLIYTSGTTGTPKGVMLTHGNLMAMCEMAIGAFRITAADHCLLVLPLFHANGILLSILSPLLAGGRTTISARFSADEFFPLVRRVRPTYFSAVPTIYSRLATMDESVRPDTSSLRFAICGAAPMPAELIGRFEQRYGIVIVEGYGLSEATCASAVNPLDGPRKPGTVGLPLPGQQIRIVDGEGWPVPDGGSGEVIISGPNVMRGYLGRPDETAKTVVDGWLHTGDVGRFEEDGYLVLVDRVKDMIIRGGENLYPKEIENALYGDDDVMEAAVVGRPDKAYGEVPLAYVALRPGSTVTVERLFELCRHSLSQFKIPVDIIVRDALPKNAVGKIDKPSLRDPS